MLRFKLANFSELKYNFSILLLNILFRIMVFHFPKFQIQFVHFLLANIVTKNIDSWRVICQRIWEVSYRKLIYITVRQITEQEVKKKKNDGNRWNKNTVFLVYIYSVSSQQKRNYLYVFVFFSFFFFVLFYQFLLFPSFSSFYDFLFQQSLVLTSCQVDMSQTISSCRTCTFVVHEKKTKNRK